MSNTKLRWSWLAVLVLSALGVGCGPRSQTLEVDGMRAEVWVEDALVKVGEPFQLRFTITNQDAQSVQLTGIENEPAVDLVVRVPDPRQGWVEVWRWSQENQPPTQVELAPGESLTLEGTWAMSQDLGADAVIVVGVVAHSGRLHEVSVGVAETLSTF